MIGVSGLIDIRVIMVVIRGIASHPLFPGHDPSTSVTDPGTFATHIVQLIRVDPENQGTIGLFILNAWIVTIEDWYFNAML